MAGTAALERVIGTPRPTAARRVAASTGCRIEPRRVIWPSLGLAVVLGALVAGQPTGAVALVAGVLLALWVLRDARGFVFSLLAFKPLVDLSWVGPSVEIAGSTRELNLQGAVAIVSALYLTVHVAFRERPKLTPPVCWLAAFGVVACISLLLGTHNGDALRGFARVGSAFPFLVVGHYVFAGPDSTRRFVVAFLGSLTVPYVLGFLQLLGLLTWGPTTYIGAHEYRRVTGGYIHPLAFYKVLFVTIPLILLVWPTARRARLKAFLALELALSCIFTAVAILRMALATAASQCLMWLGSKRRYVAATGFAVLLGAVVLSGGFGRSLVQDQIDRLQSPGEGLNYRAGLWMGYLDYYLAGSPLQQTVGFGYYVDAVGFQSRYYTAGGAPDDTHNDFLRVLVENGALGLICYLGFVSSLWIRARCWERECVGFWRDYALSARILLVSFMLMSVTINSTEEVTCFWYLLAVYSPLVLFRPRGEETARPHDGTLFSLRS